jgi:uncharacterized membrane protein
MALFFFLALAALSSQALQAQSRKVYTDPREFARAKIEKIEKKKTGTDESLTEVRIHMRVLDGPRSGEKHIAVYRGEDDMPKDMFYRQGDRVFIGISRVEGLESEDQIAIYDIDNSRGIVALALL